MNEQMDDHMNKQELNHWLHSRKWKKILLISEFVYVVILMLTLVFNFSVFMHFIVFQGIAIFIYLLVGWIFDKGDSTVQFKKRDTLWETITSIRLNRLFFIRFFEIVTFWVNVAAATFFSRKLWYDILNKPLKIQHATALENAALYGDFTCVILLAVVFIAIILASKKAMRISAILAIIFLLTVLLIQPEMMKASIVGIIGSISAIMLSYQAKL
ncbi:hypothetical protein ODV19_03305 [Lactobacillus amylovorus]|uniref:Uncharacterized protein n=1 Tax=Lactobacillus amylovorus TaxID=1604 RepID=A0AAW6B8P4_LACAM|nr:hypothetical protein [Lactobacillus amylovorus]MDA6089044.1 hypothetical protein [Lactobacillus amylovorus]MDB6246236.1 hypothetical protein [Lactobacillus amylovorus]